MWPTHTPSYAAYLVTLFYIRSVRLLHIVSRFTICVSIVSFSVFGIVYVSSFPRVQVLMLPVWPAYDIWQSLHVSPDVSLYSELFECILHTFWMSLSLRSGIIMFQCLNSFVPLLTYGPLCEWCSIYFPAPIYFCSVTGFYLSCGWFPLSTLFYLSCCWFPLSTLFLFIVRLISTVNIIFIYRAVDSHCQHYFYLSRGWFPLSTLFLFIVRLIPTVNIIFIYRAVDSHCQHYFWK
jgi:hypothetical protein